MYQQDWIAKWNLYAPHKVAVRLMETGESMSYSKLNKKANFLAHHFTQSFGLNKGDRIAVLAENCLEYLILFSMSQKTGAILVPINYRLAAPEIEYILDKISPSLCIVENKFNELINPSEKSSGARYLTISDIRSLCQKKSVEDTDLFPVCPIEPDDPIFILFTSGTTGFPKGSIYTHKMLFWNSINTSLSLIVNTESRTINVMPPFHTGGWNVLLTPFLHHGAYTCIMKKFDAEKTLQYLADEKVTIFMGVPTMLQMMSDLPAFQSLDLSSLKYVIVGGEAMPIHLIETWHEKGIPIRQGYGMTEVGPNLTSLHQDDAIRKKGSIGRQNYYVEIAIVDQHFKPVPPGSPGQLLLKGPMVSPGYWQDEEATQKAFHDGWFLTGDIVIQDMDDYLYVVDRIKNMFISGGENVYPAELERVLLQHEEIDDVSVIGVADEKWGEVGKAFIVPAKSSNITADEIRHYCKNYLAKFKIPKYYEFVEVLPRTDTGKIDRKALRKLDSV